MNEEKKEQTTNKMLHDDSLYEDSNEDETEHEPEPPDYYECMCCGNSQISWDSCNKCCGPMRECWF